MRDERTLGLLDPALAEPAGAAAGAELLLLGDERGATARGRCRSASGPERKSMSTRPTRPRAELDVAGAAPVVAAPAARRRASCAISDCGDDARGALGEDARLRHADGGDVADRVHAGEARLERLRARRARSRPRSCRSRCTTSGARCFGHAEEEVEGQLAAVVEHGDAARRVERGDAAAGDERDAALGERGDQRRRGLRRRRHRRPERDHERDLAGVADAARRRASRGAAARTRSAPAGT